MNLYLTHLPADDRMHLSFRSQVDRLIKRGLLLKLLPAWVSRLQSIDVPSVGIPLRPRDLGQEQVLSLEFDCPQTTNYKPTQASMDLLLFETKLTADALRAKLYLRGEGRESPFVVRMPSWLGVNR